MYEEITDHVLVALAVDSSPSPDRARAALVAYLGQIGTAKADEVAHELIGGPRRAPHWRASRAELLRREARRRAAIDDPAADVFDAAARVATDVDG